MKIKTGMDHAEKVSVRQSINTEAALGESAVAKKKRLRKLMVSPYFGRIDLKDAKTIWIKACYTSRVQEPCTS